MHTIHPPTHAQRLTQRPCTTHIHARSDAQPQPPPCLLCPALPTPAGRSAYLRASESADGRASVRASKQATKGGAHPLTAGRCRAPQDEEDEAEDGTMVTMGLGERAYVGAHPPSQRPACVRQVSGLPYLCAPDLSGAVWVSVVCLSSVCRSPYLRCAALRLRRSCAELVFLSSGRWLVRCVGR
ncbi:uncharacterized protein K452DRAFT_19232 [Aplosporella prunicola CBS 121167]|uniref:Uncharacterized protein n=1 Tax=Aplosporella prunicola CBS 121167 TaxID=1176127 RepID=A0A6A6BE64_9PEZI|nr:uncharacterized protein K452DRAFT_19232 [Aplosporella prunicola CBS 121167]KAF2142462.1 hypothetical protein K452DRAFT_19232 [Aplosporella prunicola CBS 121167]